MTRGASDRAARHAATHLYGARAVRVMADAGIDVRLVGTRARLVADALADWRRDGARSHELGETAARMGLQIVPGSYRLTGGLWEWAGDALVVELRDVASAGDPVALLLEGLDGRLHLYTRAREAKR
jgi:hypothetical protein